MVFCLFVFLCEKVFLGLFVVCFMERENVQEREHKVEWVGIWGDLEGVGEEGKYEQYSVKKIN